MEDEGKKYWLSIAAFVLVFIAVVVTLSTFMQQTSNRIVVQANQYVSDATAQSCVLVSTLMENTQRDIETIAALASESADVTDIVTSEEWLISVEETSPFDTIDFVDVDGMQHSPQHEPVNVSDRSYFKRAMAGESGIEAVFNTRMTHENLVYFFAPVREGADGPVVGLLLAPLQRESARRSSVGRFLRLRVPGDAVLAYRGGGGRHGFLLCWQEPYPRGAGRPLCHLRRPRSGARFCQSRDGHVQLQG